MLWLYPVWWVLGLGQFAFLVFAVPMARRLLRLRPLKVPAGFGVWLLFLLWSVLSLVMMPVAAPDTTNGSLSGRAISVTIRLLELGTATVVGLYVLNMPRKELPERNILRWLTGLFVVTVLGGLLGLIAPHFAFTAPLEHLLPTSIRTNAYTKALIHPVSAQVQDVFQTGQGTPRPAAPWGYTNFWGNEVSVLLVWAVIYLRVVRPAVRTRRLVGGLIVISLVPIVYSLNRGLWLGLGLSAAYVLWRAAASGDLRKPLAALAMIPLAGIVFIATPLHNVVQQRASHGQSNDIRSFLAHASLSGAEHSPVLGWGNPRKVRGSANSIAVGPSASCPNCGSAPIGSTGEFWFILFCQGFVGLLMYLAFFGVSFWALRRERSTIAVAARLVVILSAFYTLFYNNLPVALTLMMLSVGMATREAVERTDAEVDVSRPARAGATLTRVAM